MTRLRPGDLARCLAEYSPYAQQVGIVVEVERETSTHLAALLFYGAKPAITWREADARALEMEAPQRALFGGGK